MIRDQETLEGLRSEWQTLTEIIKNIDYDYRWVQAFGTNLHEDYGNLATTLCLIFAVSVLEHVLLQMRAEGVFGCPSWNLSKLMVASRDAGVEWQNFESMSRIRELRNQLAHGGQRIKETEGRRLITEIESQLRDWNILA